MRTTGYIIAALLIGLAFGSWSLRADLRRARQEIEVLRNTSRKLEVRNTKLDGIVAMLNISSHSGTQPLQSPKSTVTARAPSSNASTGMPEAIHRDHIFMPPHMRERNRDIPEERRSMRDQIQTATELWKMRGSIARNTFLSNMNASPDDAIQFDVVMGAMNLRLSNSIITWVDMAKERDDFTTESGLRMMNELSTVLVTAYDELDRTMPADWRAMSGTNFEVMTFINPAVAMPLISIEDKLPTRRRSRTDIPAGTRDPAAGRGQ